MTFTPASPAPVSTDPAVHNVILDCDPGHDDAVAIILAAGHPSINLLGITTVGGNQTLPKVTHNALSVARVARIATPVYPGCARPLVRAVEVAEDIHGDTGLDGVELPEPAQAAQDTHAVDFIIDTIMNNEPGTVTLVPTGPLTNIALAARKEPRIVERVREVVLMGGGYHEGNWSPVAEFNIKVDPEAAHIVFNEPWPVTMVGLDLTHQALCTPEVERTIAELGTDAAEFVVGLMGFFRTAYQANQAFQDPPVHDPCTIAYLIDPSVVSTVKVPVDVELSGALTTGMTVADFRAPAPDDCHTQVAVDLDHAKFWALVTDAIAAIEQRPVI
ncbi:ribonucleoside hydrolase [Corynebacterium sp. 13CS0277]|uniref:uridine-preferring nucleoside hydrolase UriH n=1 Tax=Corynebacterium sp. 13CS0277 TaxID=2071994 RepID=UPI000D03C386|nr:nucleoside hydrolase [Corynebacterium sp. 13CS0277]PRQ12330.1 ribonucleoside hydrolase [Corynebacterium sp. 13CS0277]